MNKGYTDVPKVKCAEDILEVRDYILSISNFIQDCDAPMTIAIQGEWGAGKTSMMNMIREKLESDHNQKVLTAWFNTWQYSQFAMNDYLPYVLMNNFLDAIGEKENKSKINKIAGAAINILKKTAVYSTDKLLGGTAAGDVKEAMDFILPQDVLNDIKSLRDNIDKATVKKLAEKNKERLVVFIDDLDRLEPSKAVELLEIIKLFLDINNCVFVLGIDYEVIVQGSKGKYGGSKGDSFFEKIIQLPFSVPVGSYNVEMYIESLLKNMGIELSGDSDENKSETIDEYKDLIGSSIGFNPRRIKRLFNMFILINDIAEKRNIYSENSIDDKINEQKILFSTICMQLAFKKLYEFIIQNMDKVDSDLLQLLSDEEKIDTWDNEKGKIWVTYTQDEKKLRYKKAASFMATLFAVISGEDNMLSEEELTCFTKILSLSSITSTANEKPAAQMIGSGKISGKEFQNSVIKALQKLNGKATKKEVNEEILKIFGDRISKSEWWNELAHGNRPRWKNWITWAVGRCKKDGLLKKYPEKNCWELTSKGQKMKFTNIKKGEDNV